jgi:hypothetical protein
VDVPGEREQRSTACSAAETMFDSGAFDDDPRLVAASTSTLSHHRAADHLQPRRAPTTSAVTFVAERMINAS